MSSSPHLWDSLEGMDRIVRTSRGVAVACGVLALTMWSFGFVWVPVLLAVVGTTAILIALFSWFRKDDLAAGPPRTR